jgi:hypothetical protein
VNDLRYFLVAYDPVEEVTLAMDEFWSEEEAESAYLDAERLYRDHPNAQVLLFSAESLESLAKTHPHYFSTEKERAPLVGA